MLRSSPLRNGKPIRKEEKMIRNLKVLGLALVAIFAMSAMVASAASAQTQGKLTTEGGGAVTLTGSETGEKANRLTAFGLSVECPGSTYTGKKTLTTAETEAGKKHEPLPNLSTTATIIPVYNQPKCIAPVGGSNFPATVTMNGCDYDLTVNETTGEQTETKKTFGATFEIVCPKEKDIEIEVWELGDTVHSVAPWCTLTVKPQANLKGAHVTSTPKATPKDDIDLDGTVEKITATRSGTKPLLCPASETKEAKFDLDVTVKGENAAGEEKGITVTD
jgi:hypothetical protein